MKSLLAGLLCVKKNILILEKEQVRMKKKSENTDVKYFKVLAALGSEMLPRRCKM